VHSDIVLPTIKKGMEYSVDGRLALAKVFMVPVFAV